MNKNVTKFFKSTIKEVLDNLPDQLTAKILNKTMNLCIWEFSVNRKLIQMLENCKWVKALEQDEGRGAFTGVDREGRYEAPFCDMYIYKLSAEAIVMDLGASSGFYSIVASHFLPSRNIYAFEPDPISRYILRLNNEKYCGGELNIDHRFVMEKTEKNKVSLDEYCYKNSIKPTLIKMDIEGGELQAIEGMREICLKYRPILLIEFHIRKLRQQLHVNPERILKILHAYGYRLLFNGHHWHLVINSGQKDTSWHESLPNHVNCAVLAEPKP